MRRGTGEATMRAAAAWAALLLLAPAALGGAVAMPANNRTKGPWANGRATFYGKGDGFSVHEGGAPQRAWRLSTRAPQAAAPDCGAASLLQRLCLGRRAWCFAPRMRAGSRRIR